jgi:glycine cleavage system transcriptional repressor
MTILRGQFAMTLVVDLPSSAEDVAADLAPVAERLGLLISVRDVPPGEPSRGGEPYVVSVHGADRPGIVHRVTTAIAAVGGNVTDLSTRLTGGLYVLIAEVELPPGATGLADDLATLSSELGVEAHLRRADSDTL